MNRINVLKNPPLNPRSNAETRESNLADDLLFFCNGSEVALTSEKRGTHWSSIPVFDCSLFFEFSDETTQSETANRTFSQVEGVGKVLFYSWTKMGSSVV